MRILQSRSHRAARALLAVAALALAAAPTCTRRPPAASGSDLARVQRWWILLGHAAGLESVDWRHQARDTQLVVLSADPNIPLGDLPADTLRLGYLSVGEANPHLPSWPSVQTQPFLIEANPDWPTNMRVDVRDPQWQQLLLQQEAPRLLQMGFQGFMLDTIDTAPYLERKDPARFAGSRQALRDFVRRLRAQFPAAVVIANGTDALVDVAPSVDGYVVEGVFATYDFGRRLYRATTQQERDWKLAQIQNAQAVAPRPVFSIEYAEVGDLKLAQWAAMESERRGFRPYVTVRDLNTLP